MGRALCPTYILQLFVRQTYKFRVEAEYRLYH